MRRVLAGLMVVLALGACSVDEGKKVDSGSGSTAAPGGGSPVATEPAKGLVVGDKAALKNGDTVQVYGYEVDVPPLNDFITPDDGKSYSVIDVEGCAAKDSPAGVVNPFYFQLAMPDNTRVETGFGGAKEPDLHAGTQVAGDCIRGFVTFEVPVGVTPVAVVFDTFGTVGKWAITA